MSGFRLSEQSTLQSLMRFPRLESCLRKPIVKGWTTGDIFLQILRKLMASLDAANAPSYNFVMDNASIHKTQEIMQEMEVSRNNPAFLPPYSPFLNPIKECFSKFKSLVKCTPMMDIIASCRLNE
jgi:hypothetical protein